MNTPEYRKAYLSNLKTEIANNNKHLVANKGQPACHQYMKNSGQNITGVSSFTRDATGSGIKWNGRK